ncbi:MAG: exodeoxyribonuclease III [Candidatus Micrarchaeum sp. ARMAN-1]|nr:MAG: exodeoxyribonuclease III [Candidatus Micrarchaeum sp. ARMAN-1]
MRIISWNINSIRARLPRLLALVKRHRPDVVCLQETKVANKDFPEAQLSTAGYYSILYGQTSYNGVAILIRGQAKQRNLMTFPKNELSTMTEMKNNLEFSEVLRGFPKDPASDEARVISACIGGLRLVNAYVINGEDRISDKFLLKGRWMEAFGNWLQNLPRTPPLLVVGDFNVAPDDCDVWDPKGLKGRIHCTPEERAWLKKLQGKRLQDVLRTKTQERIFTWWPYMRGGFNRDEGLRFDLVLGDKNTLGLVNRIWVDKEERVPIERLEPPSDHAPIIIDTNQTKF